MEEVKESGRDRDRTDDLYRVKVALIPTELRARKQKRRLKDSKVARERFQHLHGFARAAYRTGLAQDPPESGYDVAGAIRWEKTAEAARRFPRFASA